LRAICATAIGAFACPSAFATGLNVSVPVNGDIPAAVAEVGAAGGGTVTLAAGTYNLAAPILIQSNTTIDGQGSATIILAPSSPKTWSMIQNASEGISNLVIENLVLDGGIPAGAYLANASGDIASPYGGEGILLFAYTYPITNVTIQNVEIRNTGQGILTGTVNTLLLQNDYVHDNNPGNFAHNAYLVASSGVTISHSRFVNSHGGDGLHFDFGASNYTISKSDFSGNAGEGVLDEGNTGITIQDITANLNGQASSANGQNGIDTYSNGAVETRIETDFNQSFGVQHLGGSASLTGIAAIGKTSGPFYVFGTGGYGTTLTDTLTAATPNQYPAVLAQGTLGAADTADWTTQYPGYTTLGAVDFNANHLADGKLTFSNVGAVGAGRIMATLRYANGSGAALTMPIFVNGKSAGALSFPPTGGWSAWSTITRPLRLHDGANTIALLADPSGAPELDYLQLNTPVPAPPAPACTFSARAKSPYSSVLSWSAVPGASAYTILRSAAAAGPFNPIATGLTGTAYTDTRIFLGGTTYYYQLIASNQGGSANPCLVAPVTLPVDAPAGLQGAAAGPGVALNWMSANGAISFNVKRATGGGKYKIIARVPNTTNVTSSNFEQTYTDTSAASGTSYSYVVSSVGPSNVSADSYAVTVTP
jgi:hypothetical protein